MKKPDPWLTHLRIHNLLELHEEAQQVGWRVRTANGWSFDLEYEGGLLSQYDQPGKSLRAFPENDLGKEQARAFLAEVRQEIERYRQEQEQQHEQEGDDYATRLWDS